MDNTMGILAEIVEHWPALVVEVSAIIPVLVAVHMVCNGLKCLMRSDMLTIYYHNRERKMIRQYEYENFLALYKGYKALKGNSFIDKIKREVDEWEVVT
jgi:hypothetical protein